MDCIFCKIIAGEMPAFKIYEDERSLAFLDLYPGCTGHTLVIPKAHAVNFLDLEEEDRDAVFRTARKVAGPLIEECGATGLNLFQSNGEDAGQVIFHFHLHLLPRKKGDGLQTLWTSQESDSAELEQLAGRVRRELG
ncbi:MAG: HIT family protein [Candidatus Krumholzibacteria bacterium]|nr:HIT family protein [Candidatus Krumholzibacteria bacterium]MDP6797039.1 HIT family protein [Candidatus Krumholzibacteria bacterium]MDP7022076.1 HIT family protein [Candidatus Krumholzibacteria bacterium]